MFRAVKYLIAVVFAGSFAYFFYLQSDQELPVVITELIETNEKDPVVEEQAAEIRQVPNQLKVTYNDEYQMVSKLVNCLKKEKCPHPAKDEASYKKEVSRDIEKRIKRVTSKVKKQKAVEPAVAAIARKTVALPDESLREAAIELIKTQPVSAENLQATLQAIKDSESARFVRKSVRYLRAYLGSEFETNMHQQLADVIVSAPAQTSRAISQELTGLISSGTAQFYQATVKQLPKSSQARRYLERAIRNYHRHPAAN